MTQHRQDGGQSWCRETPARDDNDLPIAQLVDVHFNRDAHVVYLSETVGREDLGGVAGRDDSAVVQHDQAVGVGAGKRQIVQRTDHGDSLGATKFGHQFERLLLVTDVKG